MTPHVLLREAKAPLAGTRNRKTDRGGVGIMEESPSLGWIFIEAVFQHSPPQSHIRCYSSRMLP